MLMVYRDCHYNLKFMIEMMMLITMMMMFFYTSQIEQHPVTNAEIKRETQRENILSRVLEMSITDGHLS